MNKQLSYAQETSRLAKEYGIKFETALALDANEHKIAIYAEAREKMQALATFLSKEVLEDLKDELSTDIARKKQALKEVLGENVYNKLGVNRMGQINSERLAQDCIKQLESPLSKDTAVTPYFQHLLAKSEICAIVNGYSPQTEEGKALKLSVTPLNKSQGEYAIMMQVDNQTIPVSVASFKAVSNNFVYRGNALFDDAIISTVGEALYGNKTFGELNSAIYSAFTTDNLSGFNLHLTASQLGIEQDIPLNENMVYKDDNLDEH